MMTLQISYFSCTLHTSRLIIAFFVYMFKGLMQIYCTIIQGQTGAIMLLPLSFIVSDDLCSKLLSRCKRVNPYAAGGYNLISKDDARNLKNGYSSQRTQRELSHEYQNDRV